MRYRGTEGIIERKTLGLAVIGSGRIGSLRAQLASGHPAVRIAIRRDLLLPVIGPRRTARLIDAVWNIERVRDARVLRPLLQVK